MLIRPCSSDDLPAVTAIYAYHVLNNTGSFETDPPSLEEMRMRRKSILQQGWPYLVAIFQNEVVGYAYAGAFRLRPAYRYTVEDSIYVRQDMHQKGIARALLAELITQCELRGARQMVAVIGDSDNRGSIGLHTALGFEHTGIMRAAGWKFDKWLDVVTMQRALGMGDKSAPPQT
ncbi:L-methionine sulfoximine/L-methionine sulfone acetyltransferase [Saezia sanguinis]|uniref:L-methionine sulfoximine/L-methionine sulfone acetyltransferase n=1 Tax=Saezia sanguinis TaxID=1965230 RepID=A0A433SHS6_9BURK|nr:GNAT family N-acetyltransferase [Saezia sanguinis]RUS68307.1 L-methionine sulfoximine/L-methionine sulfone acetyltransferase [Saezia sanguinis]